MAAQYQLLNDPGVFSMIFVGYIKCWSILVLIILGLGAGHSAQAQASIVLTFDDNFIDEWKSVGPLLNELDVKATFYISGYHTLDADQRSIVQDLSTDGHEIASHGRDHANSVIYCQGNVGSCDITNQERAELYITEQILPQLAEFARDGLYPRNFAYPFGADLAETTELLKRRFGFVRDTSYYPNHQLSYVTCGDDRFVAALGIDHQYSLDMSDYDAAIDTAVANNTNLIWYGHRIEQYQEENYYVGRERLRELIELANSKGLNFKRMRDICSWQASTEGGAWVNIYDSPRALDELEFADFDGDGVKDVFRTNGRTWEVLYSHRGGLDSEAAWQHLNASGVELENLVVADFDGDRIADIYRSTNGRWYISYSGTQPWLEVQNSPVLPSQLRYADFDGDGGTDVFTQFGSDWYVSHNARDSWKKINNISSDNIDRYRFGDFNGDGKSDIFFANGGKWWVSYAGTSQWTALQTSGYAVSDLAFADLNGDGKTDVMRTTGARWYVSYGGVNEWALFKLSPDTLANLTFVDLDGDGIDEALRLASKLPQESAR